MKKTIVVADRDERLKQAFMTIFSKEHYEIVYASTGKEVEKIAGKRTPNVYVVNVNLPKMNGIHRRLQKKGYLGQASFFFLKDETDKTELLEYQADGIIEKPINFFRVYDAITSEDDVIELTDLVEEKGEDGPRQAKERRPFEVGQPTFAVKTEESDARKGEKHDKAEAMIQPTVARQLKDAIDNAEGPAWPLKELEAGAENRRVAQPELEQQFRTVLNQAMEEAADKLSTRLAPILTQYVEDYVKQILLEIAEKVIREEIDRLVKESAE